MSARQRFSQHIAQLRRGTHCNPQLQEDASRYGVEVLELEVLAFDIPDTLEKRIHSYERDWIARYQSAPGGVYNRSGVQTAELVGEES